MTIAGGIMGALFHRERTGEATTVDVSLLGTGLWAMGQALALSLVLDLPWKPPAADALGSNPLSRTYITKDGRVLWFTCLQAAKYWPTLCEAIARPELDHRPPLRRPRLAHGEQPGGECDLLADTFAERDARGVARAARVLRSANGPSSRTRSRPRSTHRRSPTATCRTARRRPACPSSWPRPRCSSTGSPRLRIGPPSSTSTATRSSAELGFDWDAIVDLKVRGVVA